MIKRRFKILYSSLTLFFTVTFFINPWQFKLFAQTHFAKIFGRVVDASNQRPLAHVEVYIKSIMRGDVTNNDGIFKIDKLPLGIYDIIFQRQGYKTIHKKGVVLDADATVKMNIEMKFTVIEVEDLVITAHRSTNVEQDVSQMVSVVSEKEIKDKNIKQTSQILKEEVGVFVQKTNQGGGSPIIRGLKANKLLLLIDGIRLNNATYRGGNLQYLNTVDSNSLEKVEVVHGPHSAMYGSDALGGVINVITKEPILNDKHGYLFSGSGSVTVSTADHTQTSHLSFMTSNLTWGILLEASYKSFGNITRGTKGGNTLMQRLQNDSRTHRILNKTQSPNDYKTFDLNTKAIFNLSEFQKLTAAYQMNRQYSVPRYDVIEAQKDSIWKFDPQERDLFYLTYQNSQSNTFFNNATITLSFHRQFERRVRQKFGSLNEIRDQFRTFSTGLQLQFNKLIGQKHHIVYGSEFYMDKIATKSYQRNISTSELSDRHTLFPDGSSFINFGLYSQDVSAIKPRWTLSLGARFSAFKLRAPFEESGPEIIHLGTLEQSTTSFTGSLGSLISVANGIHFVTNVAQGFRMPNLDDVSKFGPGKGRSFYDIPNPDVIPEKTLSFDGGFKLYFNRLKANIIGYYNYITDLLIRRPAEYNGLPFIIEEGDTLLVFRKENAGRAYTTGFEISADFLVTSNIALLGNLSYTYGQNISEDEPLPAIPPMHGFLGIRWKIDKYWVELNSRFAFKQERLSSEDKKDLRIPEGGTPGWYTFNMRFGINLGNYLSLRFTSANLLDRNYREHLSGLNAPGRNFILGVNIKF